MENSLLDELKNKRINMVKTLKANNAYDGFKKVLSEMYPENAHFIYELLQNAEDVQATSVKFTLKSDKLLFEHNGHDFTLENIEAITSVGNSLKSGNDLAIGKFGVGFKAVYTYTDTPEIHSGQFDFKIREMFIPDDDGVPKIAQEHFTRFVFPFDLITKPKQVAVREITQGLLGLDETALLFLNNIKSISFELGDGSNYYIKVLSGIFDIKFIFEIEKCFPNNDISHTYWSKFLDKCPLYVENGVKFYDVAIAYKMKLDSITQMFSVDSVLEGKVCISFPTDQTSLLHFHINAPFASTVARDNIKYCEENEKLIDALSKLTVESLYFLRDRRLLDYAAYSALPTLRDFNNQPNSRYRIFATRIKEEFENAELFITDNGKYCSINDIYNAANKDIKTILPTEYLEKLYQRRWIPTVSSVTRIEYFIDQFEIAEFSIENFIDSLEKDSHFFDELLSRQQDIEYFKTLYYLLSQSKDREGNKYSIARPRKRTRNEILQNVLFLLCEDGKLHNIKDNLFLRADYQLKHYLKNPIYVKLSFKDTARDGDIKQFLLSLGVKEMCEREDLIADVSGDNVPVDDMILKMMEIIDGYKNGTINIGEFKDSPIFIATNGDEKMHKVKAGACCWNSASAFFYQDTKYTLAQERYQVLGDDLSILQDIFSKLGGKISPRFEKRCLYNSHPQLANLPTVGVERETCVRKDFGISEFNMEDLSLIQEKGLQDESLILWKQVLKENAENKLKAVYRANNSVDPQCMESSLVYYLKRTAWIPTKSGEYKCPYELVEDDLLDSFKYEKPSLLLAIISVKPNDMAERLKSQGIEDENTLFLVDCDFNEQALAREFIEKLRSQIRKTGKSLTELAATSDRTQSPEEDDDDNYGGFHSLKNVEKRKVKLEKEFDDRESPTVPLKKLQFVLEKPNTEEKTFVRNAYHAHCQLCGNEGILTAKGKRYFEAINIFNTGKLDDSLQIKLDLGWNTLCLCPNCAAKFKYSQLTISGLIEQVESIDINAVQSEFIDISIVLENKSATIRFTPKHLLALQVAIKKIKEIESNESV